MKKFLFAIAFSAFLLTAAGCQARKNSQPIPTPVPSPTPKTCPPVDLENPWAEQPPGGIIFEYGEKQIHVQVFKVLEKKEIDIVFTITTPGNQLGEYLREQFSISEPYEVQPHDIVVVPSTAIELWICQEAAYENIYYRIKNINRVQT